MKTKIYLAGGFEGGWQDIVTNKLKDKAILFNPQKHALAEKDKYTTWDLYHVNKCDILLGYMSSNNPSGYGLALEIGYARAKNKVVILVDERSKVDLTFQRYFSICQESSNILFDTLEEAVSYIETFAI